MSPRYQLLLGAALCASSCLPLSDLASYGEGKKTSDTEPPPQMGGQGGAPASMGGSLGGGGGESLSVCGNGKVETGEDCDDAGISLSCSAQCTEWSCPSGCVCEPLSGAVFAVCSEPVTFKGAEEACVSHGMRFILPRNRRENDLIRHMSSRSGVSILRLDGTDQDEEGTWVRSDGTIFWTGGSDGASVDGAFTNWAGGQPDDHLMSQHCAMMFVTGRWDDSGCQSLTPYACELRAVEHTDCGDSEINGSEACDTGRASAQCDEDCSAPRCGDGVTNTSSGEECDDGDVDDLDACTSECTRTGLVAYYPMTETVGAVAWDVASLAHHSDLLGGAIFDAEGLGIPLDGTAHYVEVPIARAPSIVGEVTLMARVLPTLPISTGLHSIVEHVGVGVGETWLRTNGTILQGGSWWMTSENSVIHDVQSVWKAGTFYHLAARYNGVTWALFIDGEIVASTGGSQGALDLEGAWYLGGRAGRFFAGTISEVRLYEKALSSAQIQAIAASLSDAP